MARALSTPGTVTVVLAASGTVAVLLQSLVIPLIPSIPAILNTDIAGASWVLTITLLVGAVCQPIVARSGEIYGERRVLLICLAAVVVGASISALSTALGPMVVGRALQGLGMGIIPMGLSVMRKVLDSDRLPVAVGSLSATMGLGGALGIPIAAIALSSLSWEWLFWFAAISAAACFFLVAQHVPDVGPSARSARFDLPGAVGFAISMSMILVVITQWGAWGGNTLLVGLAVVALTLFVGWCAYEWKRAEPLVDLRLSMSRSVFWANSAGLVMGFSMMVVIVLFPIFITAPPALEYGLGLSVLDISWIMMPGGLAMMAAGPASAPITRAFGARTTLQWGCALVGVGYGLALLPGHPAVLTLAAVVAYSGFGFCFAAMPLIIMGGVPESRTPTANGLNTLMRTIGMTLSVAIIPLVLNSGAMRVDGSVLPTPAAAHTGLYIGIGAAFLGVFLAFGIPRRLTSTIQKELS